MIRTNMIRIFVDIDYINQHDKQRRVHIEKLSDSIEDVECIVKHFYENDDIKHINCINYNTQKFA